MKSRRKTKKNTRGKKLPGKTTGRRARPRARNISNRRPRSVVDRSEVSDIDLIEQSWPGEPAPDVAQAFLRLKSLIAEAKTPVVARERPGDARNVAGSAEGIPEWRRNVERPGVSAGPWPPRELETRHFEPLGLIRRVLMAQDLLFLSRQVTYHIASSADIPRIWADSDQVQFLISQIIEHLVRRAVRGSRVTISLKTLALRSGQGIEISFAGVDRHLHDVDRDDFVSTMIDEKPDEISGVALSVCRQIAGDQSGRLWADLPRQGRPIYHLVLPASESSAHRDEQDQQTFKYDISITNYADLRKRFGIRKSYSLISQIENYVRALVRYPIDMVVSMRDKGVVTTIYETQQGTAQSVASRISRRLASEGFRIGKRPVEVSFGYQLSSLPSPRAKNPGSTRGGAHRV